MYLKMINEDFFLLVSKSNGGQIITTSNFEIRSVDLDIMPPNPADFYTDIGKCILTGLWMRFDQCY